MDAIDILGGLLGRKSSGSGKGPEILKDIFQRATRSGPGKSADPSSGIERQARDLEDMLNVAHERETARKTPEPQPSPRRAPADAGRPVDSPFSRTREVRPSEFPQAEGTPRNEQALALVRAMLNAAKADGQISSAEEQSILKQFGSTSPEALQFLRDELSRPLDVREFTWSVPLGMEQQVYAMSLLAIDVDSNAEAEYLRELAHGLRLPAEVREQLHQRFGEKRVR